MKRTGSESDLQPWSLDTKKQKVPPDIEPAAASTAYHLALFQRLLQLQEEQQQQQQQQPQDATNPATPQAAPIIKTEHTPAKQQQQQQQRPDGEMDWSVHTPQPPPPPPSWQPPQPSTSEGATPALSTPVIQAPLHTTNTLSLMQLQELLQQQTLRPDSNARELLVPLRYFAKLLYGKAVQLDAVQLSVLLPQLGTLLQHMRDRVSGAVQGKSALKPSIAADHTTSLLAVLALPEVQAQLGGGGGGGGVMVQELVQAVTEAQQGFMDQQQARRPAPAPAPTLADDAALPCGTPSPEPTAAAAAAVLEGSVVLQGPCHTIEGAPTPEQRHNRPMPSLMSQLEAAGIAVHSSSSQPANAAAAAPHLDTAAVSHATAGGVQPEHLSTAQAQPTPLTLSALTDTLDCKCGWLLRLWAKLVYGEGSFDPDSLQVSDLVQHWDSFDQCLQQWAAGQLPGKPAAAPEQLCAYVGSMQQALEGPEVQQHLSSQHLQQLSQQIAASKQRLLQSFQQPSTTMALAGEVGVAAAADAANQPMGPPPARAVSAAPAAAPGIADAGSVAQPATSTLRLSELQCAAANASEKWLLSLWAKVVCGPDHDARTVQVSELIEQWALFDEHLQERGAGRVPGVPAVRPKTLYSYVGSIDHVFRAPAVQQKLSSQDLQKANQQIAASKAKWAAASKQLPIAEQQAAMQANAAASTSTAPPGLLADTQAEASAASAVASASAAAVQPTAPFTVSQLLSLVNVKAAWLLRVWAKLVSGTDPSIRKRCAVSEALPVSQLVGSWDVLDQHLEQHMHDRAASAVGNGADIRDRTLRNLSSFKDYIRQLQRVFELPAVKQHLGSQEVQQLSQQIAASKARVSELLQDARNELLLEAQGSQGAAAAGAGVDAGAGAAPAAEDDDGVEDVVSDQPAAAAYDPAAALTLSDLLPFVPSHAVGVLRLWVKLAINAEPRSSKDVLDAVPLSQFIHRWSVLDNHLQQRAAGAVPGETVLSVDTLRQYLYRAKAAFEVPKVEQLVNSKPDLAGQLQPLKKEIQASAARYYKRPRRQPSGNAAAATAAAGGRALDDSHIATASDDDWSGSDADEDSYDQASADDDGDTPPAAPDDGQPPAAQTLSELFSTPGDQPVVATPQQHSPLYLSQLLCSAGEKAAIQLRLWAKLVYGEGYDASKVRVSELVQHWSVYDQYLEDRVGGSSHGRAIVKESARQYVGAIQAALMKASIQTQLDSQAFTRLMQQIDMSKGRRAQAAANTHQQQQQLPAALPEPPHLHAAVGHSNLQPTAVLAPMMEQYPAAHVNVQGGQLALQGSESQRLPQAEGGGLDSPTPAPSTASNWGAPHAAGEKQLAAVQPAPALPGVEGGGSCTAGSTTEFVEAETQLFALHTEKLSPPFQESLRFKKGLAALRDLPQDHPRIRSFLSAFKWVQTTAAEEPSMTQDDWRDVFSTVL